MIAELKPKPDPKIVADLEELLEMARSGEMVGYMITFEMTGHRIGSQSSIRDNFALLSHLSRQTWVANEALGRK